MFDFFCLFEEREKSFALIDLIDLIHLNDLIDLIGLDWLDWLNWLNWLDRLDWLEDNQCNYDADKPVCDIILNKCIVGKYNYDNFVLFSFQLLKMHLLARLQQQL